MSDAKITEDIIKRSQGYNITKEIPLIFYKSFQSLSITISTAHVTFNRSLNNALINKIYLPLPLHLHLDLDSIKLEKVVYYN